jgi:hypothetical protein
MKEGMTFFGMAMVILAGCYVYICSLGGFASALPPPAGSSIVGGTVVGGPTISAQFVDQMLCKYGSPACGTGQELYNDGVNAGIDPAFGLAIFWNESNFGKSGVASSSHSLGNLRCIPDAACVGGYAAFSSWQDGYSAFYKLISGPLYVGSGLNTPEAILPRYAPSGDHNDPSHYASVVNAAMGLWRAGKVEVP